MMSASGDSVGNASSRGSGASKASRATRSAKSQVQNYTNRTDLELDQPLQHLEQPLEPLENLFARPAPVRRGNSYWPADQKQVKRSYRRNVALGFVLIVVMVGGAIFGVIFSLVKTHGDFAAANSYIANPNYTDTTTPSPVVSTTFIPSLYSTLVPSRFSTLVPSEVTIYVPSGDTTSVLSQATSLVPLDITLSQRDIATATADMVTLNPADLIRESDKVTSTTGVILSITTTVTVKVYLTAFGLHNLQSDPGTNSESQQTCDNGGQDGSCSQNKPIPSVSLTSLLEMAFTTTTIPDGADSSRIATPTLTNMATMAIIPGTTTIDKATVAFTDVCAVADISSLLPCNPLPTGWYISPSAPCATSFLHSLFRLLSTCLYRFKDGGGVGYRFLYHSATTVWTRGCNLLARLVSDDGGIGKALDATLGFLLRY